MTGIQEKCGDIMIAQSTGAIAGECITTAITVVAAPVISIATGTGAILGAAVGALTAIFSD